MDSIPLNEHDANQGAQSRGEFLGMDGNSGWYLLGAAGIALLGVIVGWGIVGLPLLACLVVGIVLCLLAIAYVFGLKNGRPEHFDTDFFEAVLIEAGVLPSNFGPELTPTLVRHGHIAAAPTFTPRAERRRVTPRRADGSHSATPAVAAPAPTKRQESENGREPVVPLAAYESLRQDLITTEDWLAEALADGEN